MNTLMHEVYLAVRANGVCYVFHRDLVAQHYGHPIELYIGEVIWKDTYGHMAQALKAYKLKLKITTTNSLDFVCEFTSNHNARIQSDNSSAG